MAIAESTGEPEYLLEPGKTSVLTLRKISIGQHLRLINFQVVKVQAASKKLTLVAPPPPNEASAPLRIRVEFDETLHPMPLYRPGDYVERVDVIVVATRESLLSDAATEAIPDFSASQEDFAEQVGTLPAELSAIKLINPLYDLAGLLDRVVETKASIIHGDLNLQNILVDTPTGFAWIIDFGETRYGPTLLDLQRLEVQVITKLLPIALQQAQLQPFAIVEQMIALHADPLPAVPLFAALQEPFHLLATTRRLARQYLIDDMDWDEYYLGLTITLVGALKYEELDAYAHSLALIAAATVLGLVGHDLHTAQQANVALASSAVAPNFVAVDSNAVEPVKAVVTPLPVEPTRSAPGKRFIGIGAGVLVAVIAMLISWRLWLRPQFFGESIGNPSYVETSASPATSAELLTLAGDITSTATTKNSIRSEGNKANDVTDSVTATSVPAEPSLTTTVTSGTAIVKSSDATGGPTELIEITHPQSATEPKATESASASPPDSASAGGSWRHPVTGATYLFVPKGEFTMGTKDGSPDTQPSHVTFLSSYWIMQTEVTNTQYKLCVDAGVCTPPANNRGNDSTFADHPVTQVTWQQADEYAHWTGGRLPTEAEWEKAARGTIGNIYPWGDTPPEKSLLNFNFAVGDTVPVGSYPTGASAYGVLDLAGNVEEWVADWYAPDYYTRAPAPDPSGPEEGVFRVLRGGSYYGNRLAVLSTSREKALPDAHFDAVGFRVAVSP